MQFVFMEEDQKQLTMGTLFLFGAGSWTPPMKRTWPSLDVGTEISVSKTDHESTVSEFNIKVPKSAHGFAQIYINTEVIDILLPEIVHLLSIFQQHNGKAFSL